MIPQCYFSVIEAQLILETGFTKTQNNNMSNYPQRALQSKCSFAVASVCLLSCLLSENMAW